MAQRLPAGAGRVDTASAKHIGGQFESRTTVINKDCITETDADLQRGTTDHSHESLYFPGVAKPANNVSGWIIVDRQPTITERSASSDTVHHSGHTNPSPMNSQVGMTPLQRWQLGAAKVESWNGVREVSTESNTTTEIPENAKRSTASSMETRKDSTVQASFNDSGRRNGSA